MVDLDPSDYVKRVDEKMFKYVEPIQNDDAPKANDEKPPAPDVDEEDAQENEIDHHRYVEIMERLPLELCEVVDIARDKSCMFRAVAQGIKNGMFSSLSPTSSSTFSRF